MDHDAIQTPTRPRPAPVDLAFRSVAEAAPGPKWRGIFDSGWPGWSAWLGCHAGGPLAGVERAEQAERALRRHMPEMARLWERLVDTAAADERAAQFLTFWTPPRYLVHCAQSALVDDDGPVLIRNYDLDPALNEGCLLDSAWLGRRVIGMVDGMAGLADGMNEAGLAVSLAFGGRPAIGRGFGVPLIVRYLLEVCSDVTDAVEALRLLPCHMSYNLTLIDRQGRHATVFLAPDRPPIVTEARYATNHQIGVEWPRHARETRTVERAEALARTLGQPAADRHALRAAFLSDPVHTTRYGDGFGTVYTAVYHPAEGTMQLAWPGLAPLDQSFGAFAEGTRTITFADGEHPREGDARPHGAQPYPHQVEPRTRPAQREEQGQ